MHKNIALVTSLILLTLAGAHCGGSSGSTSTGGGGGSSGSGPTLGGFAAPCTKNGDCDSALCQPISAEHYICTRTCGGDGDCPPAPEWSCGPVPGAGMLCLCTPSGEETCDGQDNDCNGLVDDGATCPAGLTCLNGACGCPPEEQCGGKCVDKKKDPKNCGTCGNECDVGTFCQNGICACSGGKAMCNGACVDTASDPNNCGGCGTHCGALVCKVGQCVACPSGKTGCGGTCVDTETDLNHCGGCFQPCGGSCSNGTCACPGGKINCNGDCVDPGGPQSCTSCGDGTCDAGETCDSCPADCGMCTSCGNGTCDVGETCANCLVDCGMCTSCGNGTCDAGETCASCPGDCGMCAVCGNGTCDAGETSSNCSADCGPVCDLSCDNWLMNLTSYGALCGTPKQVANAVISCSCASCTALCGGASCTANLQSSTWDQACFNCMSALCLAEIQNCIAN